jgi:integral membrane sensor domain MASE1
MAMTTENLVGSDGIRRATSALLAVALVIGYIYVRDIFPARSGLMFWLLTATGILTFMGFVHTTRGIYAGWLRFAKVLHTGVITALFGGIYLLIVPLFALAIWPFDVLKVRAHKRSNTCWIPKRAIDPDVTFFQRLG